MKGKRENKRTEQKEYLKLVTHMEFFGVYLFSLDFSFLNVCLSIILQINSPRDLSEILLLHQKGLL